MRTLAGLCPANDKMSVEMALQTLIFTREGMIEQLEDVPEYDRMTALRIIDAIDFVINLVDSK